MASRIRAKLTLLVIVPILLVLVTASARTRIDPPRIRILAGDLETLVPTVEKVDTFFAEDWRSRNLKPAPPTSDLQVLRRLSLALHGTVPSLEEIRRFEADQQPQRLSRWTQQMLSDKRFSNYFAERLARGLVGTEVGQFILFRRDRFVSWLGKQLEQRIPYNTMVLRMISDRGLWTGNPPTNFITAAVADGELDENKLAGRSARAFLGQRIDCAQCHDHPFAEWKQDDFEGLAAYFGQVRPTIMGIEDKRGEFHVEDRMTLEKRQVTPHVPFHEDWLGQSGTRRQQLAAWITHSDNRRFERAIANRVWGFVFGRPYFEPVDDLPNPPESSAPDLLDILGADFRAHDYDLRRLVQVIVASRPFLLDSACPTEDSQQTDQLKSQWAVFPLLRLRPEQVIGSILQSASITTIDQNSHVLVRFIRYFRENDFIKEYGDLGEEELQDQPGTIPQALLRMNGKLSRELTTANPMAALNRIAGIAGSDEKRVETAYLVCLTRRPTDAERVHFTSQLHGTKSKERDMIMEDLFWSMFNAPEFSWNH